MRSTPLGHSLPPAEAATQPARIPPLLPPGPEAPPSKIGWAGTGGAESDVDGLEQAIGADNIIAHKSEQGLRK